MNPSLHASLSTGQKANSLSLPEGDDSEFDTSRSKNAFLAPVPRHHRTGLEPVKVPGYF